MGNALLCVVPSRETELCRTFLGEDLYSILVLALETYYSLHRPAEITFPHQYHLGMSVWISLAWTDVEADGLRVIKVDFTALRCNSEDAARRAQ
jgi:hypothetical protein